MEFLSAISSFAFTFLEDIFPTILSMSYMLFKDSFISS
ncbi:hypothetical protein SDC9_144992 [bioreactor metagenome]|uniref:Uncharacterized protein n=1 Tax=bioreactor metagenome TaxID=1076179 RepID=A0A645EAY9_9ZZZZ